MISRRRVLATGSAFLAWPATGAGQDTGKVYHVAYLGGSLVSGFHEAFAQQLTELGWRSGQNVRIEYRWYEGKLDIARELAQALVQQRPDVLVVVGPFGALAARDATTSIPVVFALASNPIRMGLVQSLARPGGNRTGLAFDPTPEVAGKTLELLHEAIPKAKRVAVLSNPDSPDVEPYVQDVGRVARSLRLVIQTADVRKADELDAAFAAMAKAKAEALVVIPDPVTVIHQRRVAELAATHRLPAIYQFRQSVEAGGLMSYGPSAREQMRRAATYASRILRGAKPADLPVEQPSKYEFVTNGRAAKALGLMIPPSLLLRADQVIE